MKNDFKIIFKKLEEINQSDNCVGIAEKEHQEIKEIEELRKIVMDIEDTHNSIYHTST